MSDYTNYKYISNDVVIYVGGNNEITKVLERNFSSFERVENHGKKRDFTKGDEYTVTMVYNSGKVTGLGHPTDDMFIISGYVFPVSSRYFIPKIVDGKRVKNLKAKLDMTLIELLNLRDTRTDDRDYEANKEANAKNEKLRLEKEARNEEKRQERLERRAQRRSERGESVYINDKGVMSGEKSEKSEQTKSEPKTYTSTKEDKIQIYTNLMNEAAESEEYNLAIQYRDKINKIEELKSKMKSASENMDFELAIKYRDDIYKI